MEWGAGDVAHLRSMCEVLGSIPNMAIEIRKGVEKQEIQEKGREDGCSDECRA